MFMSKIVRKIYHIRKYENIEHETQARLTREKGNQDAESTKVNGPGGENAQTDH
jgi:hypothetical protein